MEERLCFTIAADPPRRLDKALARDVPALTKRGIPLTVTPDANAVSVAEHAMMLLLSASVAACVCQVSRSLKAGPRSGRSARSSS